ncbi:hypothetical protein [Nonomuraea sp. GTA35]|uniref:hypothetical protein n=1 Tax=Nonomuraea sp. GTA35 TaxID=1676746 RepID=UPI0035C17755
MAVEAYALGKNFNIGAVTVPTDAVAGAITGLRTRMKDAAVCSFVVVTTGGSTDITDIDLQEHNAATGGTSQDLDIITTYYYRSEASLDGDEQWTKGTQAAASEITNVGAASEELLLVVEVRAEQLSDGFEWVSLNVPDLGTNGTRYVAVIPILSGLKVQRAPEKLAAPQ